MVGDSFTIYPLDRAKRTALYGETRALRRLRARTCFALSFYRFRGDSAAAHPYTTVMSITHGLAWA